MTVAQPNKHNIRLLLDYQELNHHIDAFIANTDVCAAKLWEWHQLGVNAALLDPQRAYLQICVHESLWLSQMVIIKRKRHCLSHVRFGPNVAPLIMKAISAYIDDIYANESIMSANEVKEKLKSFKLISKVPKCQIDQTRVLGLEVWVEPDKLQL